MRKTVLIAFLIAGSLGLSASALPGYPYPTVWGTVMQVLDGNQIVVQIVGSTNNDWIAESQETVRYIGSYADSPDVMCGAVAAQVNYQMTFGRLVYLEFDQALRDSDGVVLAYVYLDGMGYSMVNAMLVAMGLSKATVMAPNERYSSVFLDLERTAYNHQLGCLVAR